MHIAPPPFNYFAAPFFSEATLPQQAPFFARVFPLFRRASRAASSSPCTRIATVLFFSEVVHPKVYFVFPIRKRKILKKFEKNDEVKSCIWNPNFPWESEFAVEKTL